MGDRSLLGAVVAEVDAMGEAPDMFDWSNAVRSEWQSIRAVTLAAENMIEAWDSSERFDIAEHVRAIRQAIGYTDR